MSRSGPIRQLILDGVNYRVSGDSDFDRKPTQTVESQATSGDPNFKYAKTNPDIEPVDIIVDGIDRENILDLSESVIDFGMAYVDSNGNTYTAEGVISITADNTQDAKMTIMMLPKNGWTAASPPVPGLGHMG